MMKVFRTYRHYSNSVCHLDYNNTFLLCPQPLVFVQHIHHKSKVSLSLSLSTPTSLPLHHPHLPLSPSIYH